MRLVGEVRHLQSRRAAKQHRPGDRGVAVPLSQAVNGPVERRQIRDAERLQGFEPDWTLPSRMEDNPLIWMLEVNGLLMDIRMCPREAQEVAFKKGLIPYIPADRQDETD